MAYIAKVALKIPNGGNSLKLTFANINQLGHFTLTRNANPNS